MRIRSLRHHSLLIARHFLSVFLFFIIVVEIVAVFLNDVEFYGIESHYFQTHSAFVARHDVAFIRVRVNMYVGLTIWARSGRHFPLPPAYV